MARVPVRFLLMLFLAVLIGCATIPPKPVCGYVERSTYIAEIPFGGETYYCLNETGMLELMVDYTDLRKCYADLDAWSLQVR